jgi:hypothetical protein
MKYFLAAIGGATAIMLLFLFADQGVLGMGGGMTKRLIAPKKTLVQIND